MSSDLPVPQSLKAIRPYLQHARQLEKVRPLVSYYANLYALQRGIRERNQSDEEAAAYIKMLLTKCEGLRPRFTADMESHQSQLEEFALQVFDEAKRTYQTGNANITTAQHFFAAMCFFDICTHFGDLTDEMQGFRNRAKVYAAKIRMDMRETGSAPPPQTLLAEMEQENDGTADAELHAEMSKPSSARDAPDLPPAPPMEHFGGPPTAATRLDQPPPPPPPADPAPRHAPPPAAADPPQRAAVPKAAPAKVDRRAIADAKKKAKFAMSALDFQDVKTAISELQGALAVLTGEVPP